MVKKSFSPLPYEAPSAQEIYFLAQTSFLSGEGTLTDVGEGEPGDDWFN